MVEIELTQGCVAIVDDADYELVSGYTWRACKQSRTNYAITNITRGSKRTALFMHRLLMDAPSHMQVDHEDHDGLNNRRANLRICTCSQNQQNQRKQTRETSSQFKGVSWNKGRGRWQAQIKNKGKLKYLGRFDDEEDAARAYNEEARELFGEFAKLNVIEGSRG